MLGTGKAPLSDEALLAVQYRKVVRLCRQPSEQPTDGCGCQRPPRGVAILRLFKLSAMPRNVSPSACSARSVGASCSAQITRLKAVNPAPDVIELCSYPQGGASAVRQIRAASIKTPIASDNAMDGTYCVCRPYGFLTAPI
jgi:hypothetical protein